MTRCLPYGPRCPAAVVERSLPSGRVAGHVRAVGVRVADDQVEHLERTELIREMPPSSRRLAEPGVRALDRVRGVDDLADLRREPEERGELLPRDAPEPNDRRIPLAPLRLELGESGLGRIDGRCRVARSTMILSWPELLLQPAGSPTPHKILLTVLGGYRPMALSLSMAMVTVVRVWSLPPYQG